MSEMSTFVPDAKSDGRPLIKNGKIFNEIGGRKSYDVASSRKKRAVSREIISALVIEKLKKLPDDDEDAVGDFMNQVDQSKDKKVDKLVDIAATYGKPRVLEKLIKSYGCEQSNDYGDTPIVSVLKKIFNENGTEDKSKLLPCLDVLVEGKANLFKANKEGLNAISYIAMRPMEERKEYLRRIFPTSDTIDAVVALYDALEKKDDLEFVKCLNELSQSPEIVKGCMYEKYTLLQIFCRFGISKSVKRLIELGLDPYFASIEGNSPIQLACISAHPQILKFLIGEKKAHVYGENCPKDKKPGQPVETKDKMNLLHLLVARCARDSKESLDCLKILLKEAGLNVNEKDKNGRTPLHYAVFRKNIQQIVVLLENNADVNEKDHYKQTPLMHMPESAFRKYLSDTKLDEMISIDRSIDDNETFQDDEFKVKVNFKNIFNEKSGEFFFPTNILTKLNSEKSLRKILEHPVFSIIIYFKWRNIRCIYWCYLISYIIFCLLLSLYIYFSEDHPEPKGLKKSILLNKLRYDNNFVPFLINVSLFNKMVDLNLFFEVLLSIMIIALTIIEFLKIRNVVKSSNVYFVKSIAKWYYGNLDNLLRPIIIVLTTLVILCLNNNKMLYCPQLKAFSILALYIEFYFVISKHPRISFYEVVFRKASWHLFLFIIVHIVLLLGFAFSFHILFRSVSSDNVFTNPLNALFKTIIMFTGEFDASDIPFNDYVGVSHAIFIIYIFFVTIVLLNLMISIALRHYDEMERNPFLYQTWAEIKHIEHFENFVESFLDLVNFSWCKKNETQVETETENENENKNENEITVVLNTKTGEFEKILAFKKNDTNGKVAVADESKNKSWRCLINCLDICRCCNGLDKSVIVKVKNIALERQNVKNHFQDDNAHVTVNVLKNEINELKSYIEALIKSNPSSTARVTSV